MSDLHRESLADAIREVQLLMQNRPPDRDRLLGALIVVQSQKRTLAASRALSQAGQRRFGSPLSDQEIQFLEAGGAVLEKETSNREDPWLMGLEYQAELLIASLTLEEAADRLNSTPCFVEYLASNRRLIPIDSDFGLKRFLLFQFTDRGLLQGIVEVAPSIPRGVSMVTIDRFFKAKNEDLYLNDDIDQVVSPIEWLARGEEPKAVEQCLKLSYF